MKLTKEKLKHFKDKLEEEKKILEDELSGVGRKNPSIPGDWEVAGEALGEVPDVADLAKNFEELDNKVAIQDSLEERLMQVSAALERIESDNYGVCKVDGKPIDEKRLEANPAAATCVEHAEQV
ncbi:TPA: hypothetical protein DEW47_03385 [Patescibacteria group bacterium]|nr:MAG: DnaK suppressor DskA [Parcubacteria group bacterium GW2011_GWF2_40_10]KKR47899.1 MAG: DnaK suppressor DskA [Parcubacteria group bacterium GW2011_GWA2_40_143]KKR60347.1 MAG: DnaK suppressor DskA [Parcubacteria group bacterium GW2011_GWC2_40_31]KKR75151.1 MAG: DnaK suppressor DskA [Parcubacteria group bacterium GW2011_GWB2_40_8]KKR82623.1 MAG: DnaK suppressor DskA [Parcubacteria group bacterium GW2011_GWD2_40_9]HBB56719.1 hypothetical protein [Patescibacteria group bacterium]